MSSVCKYWAIDQQVVQNRRNLILIGDIIEDVNMVKNLDYDNMISIGFLNESRNLKIDVKPYLKAYDIVIANDGTFFEVNEIIKSILPNAKALKHPNNIYAFDVMRKERQISMEDYKGKVLLIFNTASKCGFTKQLESL